MRKMVAEIKTNISVVRRLLRDLLFLIVFERLMIFRSGDIVLMVYNKHWCLPWCFPEWFSPGCHTVGQMKGWRRAGQDQLAKEAEENWSKPKAKLGWAKPHVTLPQWHWTSAPAAMPLHWPKQLHSGPLFTPARNICASRGFYGFLKHNWLLSTEANTVINYSHLLLCRVSLIYFLFF